MHLCHGNNVGHSLLSLNQTNTLTYTSLEPKSQLTINLALKRKQERRKKRKEKEKRRKFLIKRIRRRQKGKFPIKENGGKQKRKRIPDQRSEENRRNIQKSLWTRQYLNNIDLSPRKHEKKGNHDLKWSSLFDCQPKSCASVTCSPHAKQKNRKGKGQKHSKPKIPTKNTIPKKKSY